MRYKLSTLITLAILICSCGQEVKLDQNNKYDKLILEKTTQAELEMYYSDPVNQQIRENPERRKAIEAELDQAIQLTPVETGLSSFLNNSDIAISCVDLRETTLFFADRKSSVAYALETDNDSPLKLEALFTLISGDYIVDITHGEDVVLFIGNDNLYWYQEGKVRVAPRVYVQPGSYIIGDRIVSHNYSPDGSHREHLFLEMDFDQNILNEFGDAIHSSFGKYNSWKYNHYFGLLDIWEVNEARELRAFASVFPATIAYEEPGIITLTELNSEIMRAYADFNNLRFTNSGVSGYFSAITSHQAYTTPILRIQFRYRGYNYCYEVVQDKKPLLYELVGLGDYGYVNMLKLGSGRSGTYYAFGISGTIGKVVSYQ